MLGNTSSITCAFCHSLTKKHLADPHTPITRMVTNVTNDRLPPLREAIFYAHAYTDRFVLHISPQSMHIYIIYA